MNIDHIATTGAAEALATVTVDRKALHDAMAFLARHIVRARNTVPVLSRVVLRSDDGGRLELFANNLDIAATLRLDATWSLPFDPVGLEPFAVRDALKKAKGPTVEMTVLPDLARVELRTGRAAVRFAAFDPADMPAALEFIADPLRVEAPAAAMARDFAALSPAMSREESRYYLNGVAVQHRAGDLCLVATDGHNLVRIRRPDIPTEGMADRIVPRDVIAAALALIGKAGDEPAGLELGDYETARGHALGLGAFTFGDVRLAFKLVDGNFPDWAEAYAASLGEELQLIACPELEPRICADAVAKLAKPIGPVTIAAGHKAALLTSDAMPEWQALSMFSGDGVPKGYGYGYDMAAVNRAREYLCGLRDRYGLPVIEEDEGLIIRNGRAVGMTFGKAFYQEERWEERVDWDRLVTENVKVQEGGLAYPEGSYSIFFPCNERPVTSGASVTVDGEERPLLVHESSGRLHLSADAVAALVGPVDDLPRVAIEARQWHHGEALPEGMRLAPGTGPRKTKPNAKADRAALEAYCRDPEGTLAALRPVPAETPAPAVAIEPDPAPAEAVAEPEGPTVAEPAAIAPEPPQDAPADHVEPEPPGPAAEAAEEAPEPAPAATVPAEAFQALLDRVAALEARLSPSAETDPPAVESEPAPAAAAIASRRTPARERLLRRYLAMRAERARLRADAVEARQAAERTVVESAVAVAEARQAQGDYPGGGSPAIARIQEEREKMARALETANTRIADLERAHGRIANALLEEKGRALRAERMLPASMRLPPAVAFAGKNVPAVRFEVLQ